MITGLAHIVPLTSSCEPRSMQCIEETIWEPGLKRFVKFSSCNVCGEETKVE